MNQKKMEISSKLLNQAMQSPSVQAALRNKAARVLPRAKAIALSDNQPGFAEAIVLTQAERPGTKSPTGLKRPYARIGAVITPEVKDDGYNKLTRSQILKRASSG